MKTPVLIATPLREFTTAQESLSPHLKRLLMALALLDCEFTFDFACYAGGNVARGRNKIVATFLRSTARYLLFIDDDIEPTRDDVLRLLRHRQHVIGALYTTREDDGRLVLNPFLEAVTDDSTGLLPIGEIGCGCKCYHRSVFEYLIKEEPSLAYVSDEDGNAEWGFFSMGVVEVDGKRRWLSEDYWLDQLCRRHKIPVYADTKTKVKHRDQKTKIAYPPGNNWPEIPTPYVPPEPPPMAADFPYTKRPGRFVVLLQYWSGDKEKAQRLTEFIVQLNPITDLYLVESDPGAGYPFGPNKTALEIINGYFTEADKVKAVLLIEPDCVPLAPDWLEQLEEEWDRCAGNERDILGSWRPQNTRVGHINGNMIFNPLVSLLLDLSHVPRDEPWDTYYAPAFAPHWMRTGLIANRYKEVCVSEEQLRTPECGTRPPVLVHGIKDDSAWNYAQKLLAPNESPSLHQLVQEGRGVVTPLPVQPA